MVVDEGAHVDQLAPVGEGLFHPLIGPLDLAIGQRHVEVEAVGAHVEVVEPAGGGPQELGADGEALDVVVEQRLAVRLEGLPVLRLLEPVFLVEVLPVIHAPLVVGVGHAPLLAVEGHGALGRGQLLAQIPLPEVRHVLEKPGIHIGGHPVARVPVRHVRRVGRQEVADLGLVGFAVDHRQLDVQLRVHLAESLDHPLHHRARRGVGHVRKDLEIARERHLVAFGKGAAGQRGRHGQRGNRGPVVNLHGFLPILTHLPSHYLRLGFAY